MLVLWRVKKWILPGIIRWIWQGMEMTSGDIGKSAVSLLINRRVTAGTLLLELIYIVEAQVLKGLHLTRFLPRRRCALLLDAKGNNFGKSKWL